MGAMTTVPLIMVQGDSLWNRMKQNQPGLGYTEQELVQSPELFVWIMVANGLQNLRRVPPRQINVPPRSSLADVIATVQGDPFLYAHKYFTWVEMDRCVDNSGNIVPTGHSHTGSGGSSSAS